MDQSQNRSLDDQIKQYTRQMMEQYAATQKNVPTAQAHTPMPQQPQPEPEPEREPVPDEIPMPIPAPAPMPRPEPMPLPVVQPSNGLTPEQAYTQFLAQNEQRGILRVQTLTARGTFPVPGATVTISMEFPGGEYIIAVQRTDNAGKTEGLLLPAPDRALSEIPGSDKPYAQYKVRVEHPDFTTMVVRQLPVFSGESSLQILNLIPTAAAPDGKKVIEMTTTEPQDL